MLLDDANDQAHEAARSSAEETMERNVEEAIVRAKTVYEWVTGQPAPEVSVDAPYARIPPEVDREEHVIRQAATLYEKIRELTAAASSGAPAQVTHKPAADIRPDTSFAAPVIPALFTVIPGKDEIRYVFELAGVPRDSVNVELQGTNLRIFGDRPSLSGESDPRLAPADFPKMRLERVVRLPLPVDPNAVTATFADGLLTVRVRMPSADERIHKIEVR